MSRWAKCALGAAAVAAILAVGSFACTWHLSTAPAVGPPSLSLVFHRWSHSIGVSLVMWAVGFSALAGALHLKSLHKATTPRGSGRTSGSVRFALLLGTLALTAVTVRILPRLPVKPIAPSGDLVLDAARAYVAWIVENREIPGWDQHYYDASFMRRMRRFYVVCDAVPLDVKLSNDPRVVRISVPEWKETFEREGYGGNAYLAVTAKSSSENEVVLYASVMFGSLAGHVFEIRFHRDPARGMQAVGTCLLVS